MSTPAFPPPPPFQPAPAGPPALDVSGTAPVPFWRLCLVEFRKSWDTRAGFWLLAAIGIVVTLVEGFIFVVTLIYSSRVTFEDFALVAGGITSLLLPVLAIMLVTGEWTQRSAMVSFALEPRRSRLVAAKLAVALAYVLATLVAMLVVGGVLTLVCEVVQPEQTEWNLDLGEFIGFGLYQMLTMAIGFAFAALLLNTPAAIVLFFLYWYLLPIVLAGIGAIREGLGDALQWINFQANLDPLLSWDFSDGEEVAQLVVSGIVWIVVPLTLGVVRILRAEVK